MARKGHNAEDMLERCVRSLASMILVCSMVLVCAKRSVEQRESRCSARGVHKILSDRGQNELMALRH